jgi:hypothetical protein
MRARWDHANFVKVSKALVENIRKVTWGPKTRRQKEALRRLKYHGTINVMNPESHDELMKWFGFFNDLYFGGLLKGFCRIEIFKPEYTSTRHNYEIDGYSELEYSRNERDPRFKRETEQVLIAICDKNWSRSLSPKRESEYLDSFNRARSYQETLIHEMLHSIFSIYQCDCEHGCRDI